MDAHAVGIQRELGHGTLRVDAAPAKQLAQGFGQAVVRLLFNGAADRGAQLAQPVVQGVAQAERIGDDLPAAGLSVGVEDVQGVLNGDLAEDAVQRPAEPQEHFGALRGPDIE